MAGPLASEAGVSETTDTAGSATASPAASVTTVAGAPPSLPASAGGIGAGGAFPFPPARSRPAARATRSPEPSDTAKTSVFDRLPAGGGVARELVVRSEAAAAGSRREGVPALGRTATVELRDGARAGASPPTASGSSTGWLQCGHVAPVPGTRSTGKRLPHLSQCLISTKSRPLPGAATYTGGGAVSNSSLRRARLLLSTPVDTPRRPAGLDGRGEARLFRRSAPSAGTCRRRPTSFASC